MMSTSQRCGTSTCFCSRQTKSKSDLDEEAKEAATCFVELILDTEMYERSWQSAHACVVSQARRARTCMGTLTSKHSPMHPVPKDPQSSSPRVKAQVSQSYKTRGKVTAVKTVFMLYYR
jgi:hypothetical protein